VRDTARSVESSGLTISGYVRARSNTLSGRRVIPPGASREDKEIRMTTLPYSYMPDYFSLTDILCTEERMSCKVEVTLPRLGRSRLCRGSGNIDSNSNLFDTLQHAYAATRYTVLDIPFR